MSRANLTTSFSALFFACALCVGAVPTFAADQGGTVVAVESAQIDLPGSATVALSVDLADDALLGAFTIQLDYDSSVVVLATCNENPDAVSDLTSVICFEPQPGVVRLTGLAVSGAAGVLNLVELTFDALAAGSSSLALATETLADPSGVSITPFSQQNGTLAVVGDVIDSDSDGVADDADNCQLRANADQRDTNGDGFGNVCDGDFNGDCIVNAIDLGIFRLAFFSTGPDTDINGDGVVNAIDLGLFRLLFFQVPGPSGQTSACAN